MSAGASEVVDHTDPSSPLPPKDMDKEKRVAIMKERKKKQTALSEKKRDRNERRCAGTASAGEAAASAPALSAPAAMPMEVEPIQQPASQMPAWWEEYRQAEEERRATAARTRLTPVAGRVLQVDIMPFGYEGKAGVDCRLLAESACSGAMHVRKQLRDMGMCGSMLGPGPFSETEHLEGWVAGRLRRWSL